MGDRHMALHVGGKVVVDVPSTSGATSYPAVCTLQRILPRSSQADVVTESGVKTKIHLTRVKTACPRGSCRECDMLCACRREAKIV